MDGFHGYDWSEGVMPRWLRVLLWSVSIAVISIAAVLLFLSMTMGDIA